MIIFKFPICFSMVIKFLHDFHEVFFSEFKRSIEHNKFECTFKSKEEVILGKIDFLLEIKIVGREMKSFQPYSMLIIHLNLSNGLILSTEYIPEIIVFNSLARENILPLGIERYFPG